MNESMLSLSLYLLFSGLQHCYGFLPFVPAGWVSSSKENNMFLQQPMTHQNFLDLPLMASVADDVEQGSAGDFSLRDDERYLGMNEDEQVVLDFIQMIQTTPAGGLELDEVDLLRGIMEEYTKNEPEVEGLEPAQVVEMLLYRLISEWESVMQTDDNESVAKQQKFRPTAADFATAIQAWGASANPDSVIHALSILSDQRELYLEDRDSSLQPKLDTIETIFDILSSSRDQGVERRALQIFQSLEDFDLSTTAKLYGMLVTITARSRTPGAPERAEKLLREGVQNFPPKLVDGKVIGMDVGPFNAVVTAYAKSRRDNSPEKAEELIAYMDQVDSEHGSLGLCSPNINTFTSLIDAHCQQNEWESVSQADRILNRLLEQFLEGNEDLEPNVATWTIVINAWGRLSKKNRHGAADRAGRLLKRMESLHREEMISCKPDAITYVTCMNAYAFAKGGEDAGEAEKLLEEMNELYLDGDDSMKPSARSVRVVADAWIKSGDMESAEQFLDDYESYLSDSDDAEVNQSSVGEMYRSMLVGYTKQDNMERARHYLESIIDGKLGLDNLCFDRMIEGYTRIDEADSLKKSLEVFELMEKCHRNGDIKPNERVYTSFIRSMTKAKADGMHKKAEVLLKRMQKLFEEGNEGIRPTVFTYNAVLNACAESIHVENSSSDEAFQTAIRVFSDLRSGIEKPDHVTFGNMLRCARLLEEGEKREKFVSATFRLCAEQGYVNTFVLRDLQLAIDERVWRSLLELPSGEPDVILLPSSWSYRTGVKNKPGQHRGGKRGGDWRNDPHQTRGRR